MLGRSPTKPGVTPRPPSPVGIRGTSRPIVRSRTRVGSDQRQGLGMYGEDVDHIDNCAATPLDLGARSLVFGHATRHPSRMSACSAMRSMPP